MKLELNNIPPMSISAQNDLYKLSTDDASAVLSRFLELGTEYADEWRRSNRKLQGSEAVIAFLKDQKRELELCSYDQEALSLASMRSGYFFGCEIIKSSDNSYWGIGGSDSAFHNLPIIIGYIDDGDAAFVTICKNLLRPSVNHPDAEQRIESVVNHWFERGSK